MALLFAKEGSIGFFVRPLANQLACTAAQFCITAARLFFKTADLTREGDCGAIVEAAREKFGAVTILVITLAITGRFACGRISAR